MRSFLSLSISTILVLTDQVKSFTPATIFSSVSNGKMVAPRHPWLQASTTEELEAVTSMRAREIKEELESYGISTTAFLEKSELVNALVDARVQGLKPKEKTSATASSTGNSDSSSASPSPSTATSSSTSSTDSRPREERLKEEMEKLSGMKASEMRKELEERGISTASFFEKSEFLRALAEARVDGVQIDGSGKRKKKRRGSGSDDGYAEYTDVEVITDDSAGPRTKKAESSGGRGRSSPFGSGAGGSPFGGASMEDIMGNMGGLGGMGGMGGIADILKNMGGMGGAAGASPFGGASGGMGDMMGKAQQLMKNPKVMEIMMKAQSNPKVMAAMQECMSNPAAFAKYRNDPEVSELIRELEKYM